MCSKWKESKEGTNKKRREILDMKNKTRTKCGLSEGSIPLQFLYPIKSFLYDLYIIIKNCFIILVYIDSFNNFNHEIYTPFLW